MNIIQQLKDNEKPFGLMSEEMQAKALEIGNDNFHYYDSDGKWVPYPSGDFYTDQACCLRDTYEEEPEIVECEIRIDDYGDLVYKGNTANNINIDAAFHYPDFIGFNVDGWIWGCLYKNKKDPSMVHYMIKEHDLPLYDVISMDSGKVLLRRQK